MDIVNLMNKSGPATYIALKRLADECYTGKEYEIHMNHHSVPKVLKTLLAECGFMMTDIDQIESEFIVFVIKG